MTKKKTKRKAEKKSSPTVKYVVVSSRSYGNALKGIKIYYEGKKPKGLKNDGTIALGKHILEILKRKFGNEKFRWIVTPEEDSIKSERGIWRIRTSQKTLKRMGASLWDRTRDIKHDIVTNFFSIVYPSHFDIDETPVYVPGTLSHMLDGKILPRLSTEDRDAMNKFLPKFITSESLNTVNLLKATTQIKTLKELAADLEKALDGAYAESWWQTYVKKNILIIQQGYISAVEKMNVTVGDEYITTPMTSNPSAGSRPTFGSLSLQPRANAVNTFNAAIGATSNENKLWTTPNGSVVNWGGQIISGVKK